MVSSGSIESQTPSALILSSCHLKSFSGHKSSELLAFEPIHNASVFFVVKSEARYLAEFFYNVERGFKHVL